MCDDEVASDGHAVGPRYESFKEEEIVHNEDPRLQNCENEDDKLIRTKQENLLAALTVVEDENASVHEEDGYEFAYYGPGRHLEEDYEFASERPPRRLLDDSYEEEEEIIYQVDPRLQGFEDENLILLKQEELSEGVGVKEDAEVPDPDEENYDVNFVSDFDLMMKAKKSERKKHKRASAGDLWLNNDDGRVKKLVEEMRAAFVKDQIAYKRQEPAFNKLKLLPQVKQMLVSPCHMEILIDNQMIHVVAEWLSLLPNKNLPPLDIRTDLLRILHDFYLGLSTEAIKSSGLGRAIKYILHHPRETSNNKKIAHSMITEWSRCIFNLSTDYKAVSRDQRQNDDLKRSSKPRRILSDDENETEEATRRPKKARKLKDDGRKVARARIPRVSTTDYVVRPEPKVENSFEKESKYSGQEAIKNTQRQFEQRMRAHAAQRAVRVSLSGGKLGLLPL